MGASVFCKIKNKRAKDTENGSWVYGEHCKPQSPQKVLISFFYRMVKQRSLRGKYGKNISAVILFDLTVNLASVQSYFTK